MDRMVFREYTPVPYANLLLVSVSKDLFLCSYWASRITAQAIQTSCSSGAPPFPITELTITAAHEAFLNGSLTCSQLVAAYVQVSLPWSFATWMSMSKIKLTQPYHSPQERDSVIEMANITLFFLESSAHEHWIMQEAVRIKTPSRDLQLGCR